MSEIIKELVGKDFKVIDIVRVRKCGGGGRVYFNDEMYNLLKDKKAYILKKDDETILITVD